MLACVMYDLLGTFCVDEEVFLLYMEEALFCFQQMTWQRLLAFAVTWQCDNKWHCNLERCFIAGDRICCREMLVGGAQQGCQSLLPVPSHT